MWQRSLGIVGCALVAFSCGGAPAPAPKAAPAIVAPPAVPAPRTISAEVARYWVFDAKPIPSGRDHEPKGAELLQLYAGADSLMHTELFSGLVPALLAEADELLKAKQKECVQALASQARELLLGVDHRGGLAILELGPEGVKAARSACVGSLLPAERATVVGAEEAYAVGGKDVVAVQSGLVLIGAKELVEAALAPHAVSAPALSLKEDQQLVFQAKASSPDVSATGGLRVSPERFRLEADVEMPDEGMAGVVEQKINEAREQAKAMAKARPDIPLGSLIQAFDVQRHGNRFTAAFELREPVVDQARDLGVLIGLSVYGARRYIQDTKVSEAPNTLGSIALAYGATFKELPAPGKKVTLKKLVSLPAVPASVPRGVKYQSSPDDWKSWSAIHFALTEPQYFQYEVVAAKDGKTAEIIARGDLDGNGKASLFRLKIELDPKTGEIKAVGHNEEEPLE
jgi:hypothetical protein